MNLATVLGRIAATVFITTMSVAVLAQTPLASVSGRVLDPNGAAIVEATVIARNVDTGVSTTVQTNEAGIYHFVNLAPGIYEVSVSKKGFNVVLKPGVDIHIADNISMNFNMPVGSVSETVTVTAGAPILNTTEASVSTVVDQSYVANMPLNGRSFQDLILLTPGIVTNSPQSPSSLGQTGEFSVNGQRTESNNYTVDGVSANIGAAANTLGYAMTEGAGASGSVPGATALGTTQALVSVDDLQEFRVESSTYSAQYGRNPGGQFAFETKSGTNQWHGTASEYLRNDYFDSTDYFTNWLRAVDPTLKKAAVRQNDFGGTFGGPVEIPGLYNGRDKTFFFVSYEGLRLRVPQAAASFPVPDLCMRGDVASCPAGRAPAATALLPIIDAFPVPNGPELDSADGVGEFVGTWSNPASINATSVRLDHSVGQRLRLFFRFSNTTSNSVTRGSAADSLPPSGLAASPYTTRTYTGGANSMFTNSLSNEFRLNYSTNVTNSVLSLDNFGGAKAANLVQLAQLNNPYAAVGALFILGSNFINIGQQITSGAQHQWNLVDTMHAVRGRHQFTFGVDYRRLTPYAKPFNPILGYFYGLSGTGENDVEQNNAAILYQADNPAYPLYNNYSLFAQDEWKTTQRLTLSLGLRWELNPPPGATQGLMPLTAVLDPTTNQWQYAPKGTPLWKTTWLNFAPRLGAAYIIHNTPGRETVVRGGGGLFFDSGNQVGSLGFDGPGFSLAGFGTGPFPTNSVSGLTDGSVSAYGYYPHLQLPYTLQWNASVEQALGASQAVTMSYVGSHAGRLLQTNRFDSSLALNGVFAVQNGSTSDYNSAQLQYRRRLSHGLTALGSYTWSHCLDAGSSNANFGYQKGNCDFDVRHNFSAAFSYDLPGAGHGGIAGALLHHWGIDDRFMARSAFPVTLVGQQIPSIDGKVYDAGLSFVPGEPVYLYGANCASVLQAAGKLQSNQTCPGGRAINPNAFVSVNSGYGNTPRNFARLFGAWQMNLGVRREFPIHERLKLQFRAEAFNAFNHPNFGTVNGQLGQPTFGQATATLANSLGTLNQLYQMGGPRSMQFALKLLF